MNANNNAEHGQIPDSESTRHHSRMNAIHPSTWEVVPDYFLRNTLFLLPDGPGADHHVEAASFGSFVVPTSDDQEPRHPP